MNLDLNSGPPSAANTISSIDSGYLRAGMSTDIPAERDEIAHSASELIGAAPSRNPNRWEIAIAGSIVMLLIGTIYSWAIFTEPLLVAFHWDFR